MDLYEISEEYLATFPPSNYIPRELKYEQVSDIFALVGPRRAGKTTTLLSWAAELKRREENVLFLVMADPVLKDMDVRTFAKEVRKVYPAGTVFLFLDEVQEWAHWDWNVRWLQEMREFRVILSGSTAELSIDRIPSLLRGRYYSKLLLPLSFREIAGSRRSTGFRGRARLERLFEEYSEWGGFPEVWLSKSREKLLSIYESMFFRDIVDHFGIRERDAARAIYDLLIRTYANMVTVSAVARTLRARGLKVSREFVSEMMRYMEWAFAAFTVELHAKSPKKSLISPKKLYLVDVGFARLGGERDLGRILENLVFLELLRRGEKPRYYLTRDGKEVDFVTGESVIEVAYEPDEEHIRKVMRAAKELKRKPLLVVYRGDCDVCLNIVDFLYGAPPL